jgi:hypothetical protein
LTELYHPGPRLAAILVRAARTSALSLVLIAGLAGCSHKTRLVLPQGAMSPVELEVAPELEDPPMIAAEPTPEEVPLSEQSPPAIVVKRRPAPPKETPPVQVASAAEPLALGALSAGGESTPQSQQQAKDLIAAIKRRLAALPGKTASQQRDQIRQVNYFLKQAQQALDSGDAEGAKTLATKAKLLMDDVEKK